MPESLSFFLSFLKIGIFTFGGGYAMIPLVQREVIDKGWVKEDEFFGNCSRWRSRLPWTDGTQYRRDLSVQGMATGDARRRDGNYPARFLIILVIAIFFN